MLAIGGAFVLIGIALMGFEGYRWYAKDFGPLDLTATGKVFVPGICSALIGMSLIFHGFSLSILNLKTRKNPA